MTGRKQIVFLEQVAVYVWGSCKQSNVPNHLYF